MRHSDRFDERHVDPRPEGRGHDGDEIHHDDHGPEGRRGRLGWARFGFGFGRGRHEHGPRDHEHFGGRARRGEVRFVLLDALRDGPKHGYEIVKTLEERSAGQYVPSPGTVYPTMQFLQDEGLVTVDQDGDRRVFKLTDSGKAQLAAHAAEVEGFWARFEASGVAKASRIEITFLQEELESLHRTIRGGLDEAITRGDQETIRRVRQSIEHCRTEIRAIISGENAGG